MIYHELTIKLVFSAFYKATMPQLMCKSIKNNMNIIKFVRHKQALLQQYMDKVQCVEDCVHIM